MSGLSTFELYKHLDSTGVELSQGQVRQVQEIVWSLAQRVIDVCDSEGIPYMLDGGSCLGAVRHGGFIPWDDDMDMSILRADYERFLVAVRREMGQDCWIHTPEDTHNYGLSMVQLRLKGTVLRGKDDFYGGEWGVPLDIFVIENAFDNPVARVAHGIACNAAGFLQACKKTWAFRDHFKGIVGDSGAGRKSVRLRSAVGRCLFWASLDQVTRFTVNVYSLCGNGTSRYVTFPSGRGHYFGEMHERDVLMPPSKELFEGREVSMPAEPARYLSELFGSDFMELPPEDARERHVVLQLSLGSTGEGEGV